MWTYWNRGLGFKAENTVKYILYLDSKTKKYYETWNIPTPIETGISTSIPRSWD